MDFRERYQYDPQKDLLGKGGFSVVFKARDTLLDRDVALKFFTSDAAEKYGILAEIKRVINLHHQNIVQYYDAASFKAKSVHGRLESVNVGILEYVNGGSLNNFLKTKPDGSTLNEVITGILDGLNFIHGYGIIHRDIKPENILMQRVGPKWIPKINDFGISKQTEGTQSSNSSLMGTVEYMAPEQFNPMRYGINGKISTNVDLWSFGVILYEIFSGKPLYGKRSGGISTQELMMKICNDPLPVDINRIPEPYREIVNQCLVRNANDRVSDAVSLLSILQNHDLGSTVNLQREQAKPLLAKKPGVVKKSNTYKRIPETSSKRNISPLVWIAISMAILLFLAGVIYGVVSLIPEDNNDIAVVQPIEKENQIPENQTDGEEISKTEQTTNNGKNDEAETFENSKIENSVIAYQRYLNIYPAGIYAEEARNAIELLSETERATTLKTYTGQGELIMKSGDYENAVTSFQRALIYTVSAKEKTYLELKIIECKKLKEKKEGQSKSSLNTAEKAEIKTIQPEVEKKENKNPSVAENKESIPEVKTASDDAGAKVDELFQLKKSGVLRGISFNMGSQKIKSLETGNTLLNSTAKEISYDFRFSSDKIESATLNYSFQSGILLEVKVQSRQKSQSSADILFEAVKKSFNVKYGNAISKSGLLVWTSKDINSGESFQVTMEKNPPANPGLTFQFYMVKD